MRAKNGQIREYCFHARRRIAGDGGDADFLRTDRGDVGLAQTAPMHLHHAAPGLHPVMTAGSESPAEDVSRTQAHRLAHSRGLAIRTDRVAIDAGGAIEVYGLVLRYTNTAAPGKPHTQFPAALDQQRMKLYAPDADSAPALERSRRMVSP
jgi:hypothetical protein